MDPKHQQAIQTNFARLVEDVDLLRLLDELNIRGVLTERQREVCNDDNKNKKDRKRFLFNEILQRGPHAFKHLVDSLNAIDYKHQCLANFLEGKSPPNKVMTENSVARNKSNEFPKRDRETPTGGAYPFKLPINQRPNHIRQVSQDNPDDNINLTEEPVNVQVILADRFYDDPKNKVPTYSMRGKNRGIYFCVNNIEFINNCREKRIGAEIDHTNLKSLFGQMNFIIKDEYCLKNQTARDVKENIRKFTKDPDLRTVDCAVIALMSHGQQGHDEENSRFITVDGNMIEISWVLRQFSNINCEYLRGKPKIFLIQICRGDEISPAFRVSKHTQNDGEVLNASMRQESDMLIGYSTLPGRKSYRDLYLGTWYIDEICRVFMNHACDTDVESMLKMVDKNISMRRDERGNAQTCSYENRGFDVCYLQPGMPKD